MFATCQEEFAAGPQNLCPTPRTPEEVFLSRLEELVEKVRTAETAAGLAGVDPSTVSNWRGRKRPVNPTMRTLTRIADALGVPPSAMLSDEADPRPRTGLDPEEVRQLLSELRHDLADGAGAAIDRVAAKLPELKRGRRGGPA